MITIDYARIATAVSYYVGLGYVPTEVPWIVGERAYEVTKPPGAVGFVTLRGYLVASAEQGFIQLLQGGAKLGKCVAVTPCFRHETYDDLHLPYFMKVELIATADVSDTALTGMIREAEGFFNAYIRTQVIETHDGYDIVEAVTGIELGSYGRRQTGDLTWLYGTGLAEPRLAKAIQLSRGV